MAWVSGSITNGDEGAAQAVQRANGMRSIRFLMMARTQLPNLAFAVT
jgi:hypothetical protein